MLFRNTNKTKIGEKLRRKYGFKLERPKRLFYTITYRKKTSTWKSFNGGGGKRSRNKTARLYYFVFHNEPILLVEPVYRFSQFKELVEIEDFMRRIFNGTV